MLWPLTLAIVTGTLQGGFVGMYLGARCQRRVPGRAIEFLLCGCVLFVVLR